MEIRVKLDLDKLTFGDAERLDQIHRSGKASPGEIVQLLEKFGVENIRELPLSAMSDILEAITKAVSEAAEEISEEPGVPEGNA